MIPSAFNPSKPQLYSINARMHAVGSTGQLQAKAMGKRKDSTKPKWIRQHRKIYLKIIVTCYFQEIEYQKVKGNSNQLIKKHVQCVDLSFEILKEQVVYGGHVSSLLTNLQRQTFHNLSLALVIYIGRTGTDRLLKEASESCMPHTFPMSCLCLSRIYAVLT